MTAEYDPPEWVRPEDFGVIPDYGSTYLDLAAGTSQGVDQTAAVVSMMARIGSRTSNTGIGLLLSGPITACCPVASNTTIQGLYQGCGFKRPQGSSLPALYNLNAVWGLNGGAPITSNPGTLTGATLGGFTDTNIVIRDLTLHGGAGGVANPQLGTNGPIACLRMFGVDGVIAENIRCYDSPCYAIHINNCHFVRVNRSQMRIAGTVNPAGGDGRDGIHLSGPMDDVLILGCAITSGDDALCLAANDGSAIPGATWPVWPPGAQTRIDIQKLTLDGCCTGIRLLSSVQRIDGITIAGVRGTTFNRALMLDPFESGDESAGNNPNAGVGNIGSVTVHDWEVNLTNDANHFGQITMEASFERFAGTGLRFRPSAAQLGPYVEVLAGTSYGVLDLEIDALDTDTANRARVLVQDDGVGASCVVRGSTRRPGLGAVAFPTYRKTTGTTDTVRVFGGPWASISNVVDWEGGQVNSLQINGVHESAGGGGSVNVASGLNGFNLERSGLISIAGKSGAGTWSNDSGSMTATFAASTPSPASTLLSGLQAYYRFDETSGTSGADSSGNSRSLTAAEAITGGTGKITAHAGKAALFDGTAQTYTTSDPAFVPGSATPWYLAGWIKLTTAANLNIVLGSNNDSTSYCLLYWDPAGFYRWQVGVSPTSANPSAACADPTQWAFLELTWDGSLSHIAINGGAFANATATPSANSNPASVPFLFGADSRTGTRYFLNGMLDGWGLWNRTLTTAERAYLYSSGAGIDVA